MRAKKEENKLRVGEGIPSGRFAKLYNPEIFEEHEEVIVFTREDIERTYTSIMAEIDDINKINLHLDRRTDEWKLIGYWPQIMQKVHHIDMNMDLIFKKEPLQAYLDSYLYNDIKSPQKNVAVSQKRTIAEIKVSKLNLL